MRFFRRAKEFDVDKLPWQAFETSLLVPLEAMVADATAGAIASALARGLEFDAEAVAAAVAEMLPGYSDAWLTEVVNTTRERVSAAVTRYTSGETSLEELLASVDTLFDEARADLIATTETTRLYDTVNQVINQQAGVEKVRYLTVRDPFVCPICSPLDNQVYTAEDSPHPPFDTHPGCRCFLAAEVPEATSRTPVVVAA